MSDSQRTSKFLRTLSFIGQLIVKRMNTILIMEIPPEKILDIGGGGEGIIAQVGRERVTAVDKYQSEINQAKHKAPEATWVLADATKLGYSENFFDNATSFFSIMYMSNEDKSKVFQEVYRVLKPEGEFWVWDASISSDKGVFFIKVKAILPNKEVVRTGYGVSSKIQTSDVVKDLLENIGFKVEVVEDNENWYFLKAKK